MSTGTVYLVFHYLGLLSSPLWQIVNEVRNLHVVEEICDLLDELEPRNDGPRRDLITFVTDRPGHDQRYAIDAGKIQKELDWSPRETFSSGLRKTVRWYLDHREWWQAIRGDYDGARLGLGGRR